MFCFTSFFWRFRKKETVGKLEQRETLGGVFLLNIGLANLVETDIDCWAIADQLWQCPMKVAKSQSFSQFTSLLACDFPNHQLKTQTGHVAFLSFFFVLLCSLTSVMWILRCQGPSWVDSALFNFHFALPPLEWNWFHFLVNAFYKCSITLLWLVSSMQQASIGSFF